MKSKKLTPNYTKLNKKTEVLGMGAKEIFQKLLEIRGWKLSLNPVYSDLPISEHEMRTPIPQRIDFFGINKSNLKSVTNFLMFCFQKPKTAT